MCFLTALEKNIPGAGLCCIAELFKSQVWMERNTNALLVKLILYMYFVFNVLTVAVFLELMFKVYIQITDILLFFE